MAHWGQNMIVHRFAEHYPAVFVVSKAISTTLAGCGLFNQRSDFHRGGDATGDLMFGSFLRPLPFAHNFLDSIKFV